MSHRMEQATIGDLTLTSAIKDYTGAVLFCSGSSVPTGAGYAPGCYFASSTGAGYINKGTVTTANFTAVTQA